VSHLRSLALAVVLLAAAPALARGPRAAPAATPAAPAPGETQASEARADDLPGASPGRDVVGLRFAWPAPSEAQVTYRRTRSRTGERPTAFVARYTARVAKDEGGLAVRTAGTRWEGDLPFPRAVADAAIRASERVVQRIAADGEFAGLEHDEAMRPVLAQLLADASLPPEQAERAIALGLAGMRAESEELWNLAVGFWIGADLEVAAPYVMEGEAELPLVPGVRSPTAFEFRVRRRVPCSAAERTARCVEVTLRATPDAAAVERARSAILARVGGSPAGTEAGGEAPDPADPSRVDLALESELLLVTDPATLLPRRLVWTKAIRAGAAAGDGGGGLRPPTGRGEAEPPRGAPALELVDRSEYDYRYEPARPPKPPAPPRRTAPRPKAPPPPAPAPAAPTASR
jgi:hypothetical protein